MATVSDFGSSREEVFSIRVASGALTNWTAINKFGRNSDIDSAAQADIWDAGGSWTSPTGSSLIQVFSGSTNDSAAGTGARTVTLQGLDSDGLLQNETVTMAGAARVSTNNSFGMVHRMFVATSGSGGENSGAITALNPQDTSLTLAQIGATNNQSLMAIFRIPSNMDGFMPNFYATILKDGPASASPNVTLILRAQSSIGGVWQVKNTHGMANAGAHLQHFYDPPNAFSANQTVALRVDTDTANTNMSGGFDLYLKKR